MSKETILVVEDRKDLARVVKLALERAGYRVVCAADGERGLAQARRSKPALVILDIVLPKMNGLEFCRRFKQRSQAPVIFLTGQDKEVDKIVGLRLGADDYMTKPFSVGELEARVEAVLRRARRPRAEPAAAGRIEIDLERHEVRIRGKRASLTAKEYQLLEALLHAEGKVLTRPELLKRVWGYEPDMDVDTRTLEQLISRLRRKLGPERDRIATVAGFGYRLQLV